MRNTSRNRVIAQISQFHKNKMDSLEGTLVKDAENGSLDLADLANLVNSSVVEDIWEGWLENVMEAGSLTTVGNPIVTGDSPLLEATTSDNNSPCSVTSNSLNMVWKQLLALNEEADSNDSSKRSTHDELSLSFTTMQINENVMPAEDNFQSPLKNITILDSELGDSADASNGRECNEASKRVKYLEAILEAQQNKIKELNGVISKFGAKSKETEEDQEWEVEEILDMRNGKDKNREFLVRWKKFSPLSDSWEPEMYLNCDEKLELFFQMKDNDEKLVDIISNIGNNICKDTCESDGDDNKDDKGDKEYEPDVASLACDIFTAQAGRKSTRSTKPPDTLNYKHKPSCYQCGRSARNIALPDSLGAIFCSMNCSRIWERKIKK